MKSLLLFLFLISFQVFAQDFNLVQIARLKYSGGGDWYNDPSSEVNLLKFVAENTSVKTDAKYQFVEAASNEIFNFPFLFLTGHGNINFTNSEVKNLRAYLEKGGFIYIDDDYGLDSFVRLEMKKVFPEKEFLEIPFNHEIYHIFYNFESGPPKIHEHDSKPAQGFGIFIKNRLAVYYTFESNPSDGWADKEVHNDDEKTRRRALEFGTNILLYVLTH